MLFVHAFHTTPGQPCDFKTLIMLSFSATSFPSLPRAALHQHLMLSTISQTRQLVKVEFFTGFDFHLVKEASVADLNHNKISFQ